MAKASRLEPKDPIELQEDGHYSRGSQGREDSDTLALRQAGKNPVLKVRLPITQLCSYELMTIFSVNSVSCPCSALAVWSWARGRDASCESTRYVNQLLA